MTLPLIVGVGFGLTVTGSGLLVAVFVHPVLLLVTVSATVPFVLPHVTVMAPVPWPLQLCALVTVHAKLWPVSAGVCEYVTVCPWQTLVGPVIAVIGSGLTVTLYVAVPVQTPPADSTTWTVATNGLELVLTQLIVTEFKFTPDWLNGVIPGGVLVVLQL